MITHKNAKSKSFFEKNKKIFSPFQLILQKNGKNFQKTFKKCLTSGGHFAIIVNCIIIAVISLFASSATVHIKTIIYAYARILAAQM